MRCSSWRCRSCVGPPHVPRAGLAATSVTETRDGVRVLLRGNSWAWAAAVLAWLGCTFEIEYPDELRTEVLGLADRLTRCASAEPGDQALERGLDPPTVAGREAE